MFRLKDFFSKKTSSLIIDSQVDHYIHTAASILKVHIPSVRIVDVAFESYITGVGQIYAIPNIDPKLIPGDANFIGGHYSDSTDTLIIAAKFPTWPKPSTTPTFVDSTMPERLFIILHELRHVWQHTYHHNKFYQHNAVGIECIQDEAEIDADAFALAYIFSEQTPFTLDNFPTVLPSIKLQCQLNGGKRWLRALTLANEYGFNIGEKFSAAKEYFYK